MVIITGATGFIGRLVIRGAVKAFDKSDILCLVHNQKSKLEDNGRQILKELAVKIKEVDLVTGKGLNNLPKSPNLIIHLAANPDTNMIDHRCNNLGTANLLKALGPLSQNSHFVHISTMVAFSGRADCSKPLTEQLPLSPTNEYTRTKAEAEKILIKACQTDGFRLTILRPNTVYGQGMRPGSLFDFVKKMVVKKSLFTRLNWPGLTSLVHVDDIAKAIIQLAKKSPPLGRPDIYLINGQNLTLAQISKLAHQALKLPYQPIQMPGIFWTICLLLRKLVPLFEKITSPYLYNLLWRASLIVDNSTYCRSNKLAKTIPWKPHQLKDKIDEVI